MPHDLDIIDDDRPAVPPRCAEHPGRPAVPGVLSNGRALCVPCHLRAILPAEKVPGALIDYYARESAAQRRRLMGGDYGR